MHAATGPASLASIFCNETHVLADYRQAALVGFFGGRRTQLVSHSGPVEVGADSPCAQWLADAYGNAWWALAERRHSFAAPWSLLWARRVLRWVLSAVPLARTWQRKA